MFAFRKTENSSFVWLRGWMTCLNPMLSLVIWLLETNTATTFLIIIMRYCTPALIETILWKSEISNMSTKPATNCSATTFEVMPAKFRKANYMMEIIRSTSRISEELIILGNYRQITCSISDKSYKGTVEHLPLCIQQKIVRLSTDKYDRSRNPGSPTIA